MRPRRLPEANVLRLLGVENAADSQKLRRVGPTAGCKRPGHRAMGGPSSRAITEAPGELRSALPERPSGIAMMAGTVRRSSRLQDSTDQQPDRGVQGRCRVNSRQSASRKGLARAKKRSAPEIRCEAALPQASSEVIEKPQAVRSCWIHRIHLADGGHCHVERKGDGGWGLALLSRTRSPQRKREFLVGSPGPDALTRQPIAHFAGILWSDCGQRHSGRLG